MFLLNETKKNNNKTLMEETMEKIRDNTIFISHRFDLVSNCLSNMTDFISSKGLGKECVDYLKKVDDKYYLDFLMSSANLEKKKK